MRGRYRDLLLATRVWLGRAYGRRPDLVLTGCASVLCALIACLVPYVPVRVLAAAPMALVLPGYAFVSAVFVGRDLSLASRFALIPAMSLAVLVIGALVLDFAPGGLETLQWALLITIVTLSACAVGVHRTPDDYEAPVDLARRAQAAIGGRIGAGSVTVVLLAGVLAVAALVVSRIPLSAPNSIGYTQLYMLPSSAQKGEVRVGVQSDQLHPAGYRLVVSAPTRQRRWTFTLRPGQTELLTAQVGETGDVTATLFRDGEGGSYRRVTLNR